MRKGREKISLYLVDDHTGFRHCLQGLLDRERDLRVVGQADDGEQALLDARQCSPAPLADLVLLDIALPGIQGIALAQQLCGLSPRARLVGLSTHEDPVLLQALLAAGARACLSKSEPMSRVLQVLREVAAQPHSPR